MLTSQPARAGVAACVDLQVGVFLFHLLSPDRHAGCSRWLLAGLGSCVCARVISMRGVCVCVRVQNAGPPMMALLALGVSVDPLEWRATTAGTQFALALVQL